MTHLVSRALLACSVLMIVASPVLASQRVFLGHVVNDAAAPVGGATLVLYYESGPWGVNRVVVDEAVSFGDGSFELTTGSDAWLKIEASHPDHVSRILDVAGLDPEAILIELSQAARLTVSVVDDETGLPLQDQAVSVRATMTLTVQTDEHGEAGFAQLVPGAYQVCRFGPLDGSHVDVCFDNVVLGFFQAMHGDQIELDAGDHAQVELRLPRGGELSGHFTRARTGEPIANQPLQLRFHAADGSPLGSRSFVSDAVGGFRLGALPAGEYYVRADGVSGPLPFVDQVYPAVECRPDCPFEQALLVATESGELTGEVDFPLSSLASVQGVVVDAQDGDPIAGAEVKSYTMTWIGSAQPGPTAISDAQGGFVIDFLWPTTDLRFGITGVGGYRNLAWPAETCLTTCSNGDSVRLEKYEHREDVEFAMQPGPTISGQIRDRAHGRPLQGRVRVFNASHAEVWNGPAAANGSY
jgi:hypothetical protein